MLRFSRQACIPFVLAVVAATVIATFRGRLTPVLPRPAAAPPASSGGGGPGLHERIQISMAAASARNAQAFALCESEINSILAHEFAEIARKGDLAAAEVAGFQSCCGIIFRLAKDKVFGGDRASAYVDQELGSRLRPALATCSREIDTAIARFDHSLAESTVTLAAELAQASGATSGGPPKLAANLREPGDLDTALRNLGYRATGVGVGISLDVWAILNSRLAQSLISKATTTAARVFARPAAAAAAELTAAAADGPLPIGDAIAFVGGIWTIYDISVTRAEFERELKVGIANALPDMKRTVHDQIMSRIRGTIDAHRRAQDSIRMASTNDLPR